MNGGPGFTQVAVVAASCCVGHICMGGGGGSSCMLLLHPVPASADAGPLLMLVSSIEFPLYIIYIYNYIISYNNILLLCMML